MCSFLTPINTLQPCGLETGNFARLERLNITLNLMFPVEITHLSSYCYPSQLLRERNNGQMVTLEEKLGVFTKV